MQSIMGDRAVHISGGLNFVMCEQTFTVQLGVGL